MQSKDERGTLSLLTLDDVGRRRFDLALKVMLGMAVFAVALQPILAPGQEVRSIGPAMMGGIAALALLLNSRQHMRESVVSLVFGSWLVIIVSAVFNGGVFAPGLYALPILLAICAWTLGMRAAVALGILTIASEMLLAGAGLSGQIAMTTSPPLWQLTIHSLLLIAALAFVDFSLGAYHDRIQRIRSLSSDLEEKVRAIEIASREQQQQALHYRALLDAQSSAGFGLFMIKDRRIVFANDAVCAMLGYAREELHALPSYAELLHPDDYQRVVTNHERRLRGEQLENRHDIVVMTKSGKRRDAEITVGVIADQTPPAVLVILADITERKRVERELSLSREMFSHVFQSNPVAVAISRLADGRYLDVNASHCRLFRRRREDVMGRSAVELGIWQDNAQRERWVAELRKTGKLANYAIEMFDSAGRALSTEITAEIFSLGSEPVVLSFVSDYTDLRQAEAGLRQSEERFGRAFQASPVATVVTRLADGAYLDANEAFTRNFGWERSEALATNARELGIWPDPEVRARWLVALKGQGAVRDFDVELCTKSGERRQCIISAELIDFGDEHCLIALIHDITDRRRAEDEVRRLNAELEDRVLRRTTELTEANQELEAFAYSISHDLRAPLRGIDGFSRLLQEEYEQRLDGQGREYLARVRRAAQRMGVLIDDLLELSRMTRQEMTRHRVDLSMIAAEVLAGLRHEQPERDVEVVVQTGCECEGDPQLLRVLLENLLGNAWKYTRNTAGARIEFGADGDAFQVADNGVGFDMAYADKLFSPFQRLHNPSEFEGSGIGLASVRRIVRRHGGEISADAAPGRGARFRFTLPVAPADKT